MNSLPPSEHDDHSAQPDAQINNPYPGLLADALTEAPADSEQAPRQLEKPKLPLLEELPGYELIVSPIHDLGAGLQLVKTEQRTNTTVVYDLVEGGEVAGSITLAFGLKAHRVGFDITIRRPGQNLAVNALRRLASLLSAHGFELHTGGILPESRPYWQHLADKGEVIAVDKNDPQTTYVVPPAADSDRQAKAS